MIKRLLMLLIFSAMAFIFIFIPNMQFFSYFNWPYHWVFSMISALMFPLGFQLISFRSTKLTHRISLVSTGVFASTFLIVPVVLIVELVWFIFRFPHWLNAWLAGFLLGTLIIISVVSARLWRVKKINISSSKIKEEISFVQISDVHANGDLASSQLKRVFTRAMKLNPDFIVVTGDLVDVPINLDNGVFSVFDNIKIPIYYELGNHETYVGLDKIRKAVKKSNLTLLENTSKSFGDISLISINDSKDKDQVANILPTIKRDTSKFQLLLYHKPWGYEAAANQGIDLMLCGHTHAGQFFPIHIFSRAQYKYMKNTHKIKDMIMHVSAGSGTFMWPLRLGSTNELTHITLSPQ